jgi:hypothetical protein
MSKIDSKSKNLLKAKSGKENLPLFVVKIYLKTDLILQLKFTLV